MLTVNFLIRKTEQGFTLIELAIVLVIIGVLAGTFLSTLGSRIDTTRRAEAAKEMEIIKQALYGYAMTKGANNRPFPCPDCRSLGCATILAAAPSFANDGIEDRTISGKCALDKQPGNLPWATLGLGNSDPWGNRYSYWVSGDVAGDNAKPGFDLTTPMAANAATIRTRIANALPTPTPDISNSAIAIIMTQGKNGYGAISAQNLAMPAVPVANVDERDNLNNNGVYFSRPSTDPGASTAGGEFDDMLIWISEYELKAKMVEAGVLP